MSKFFPTATAVMSETDAFRVARAAYKNAAKTAMQSPEGEAVVEEFKANGAVNGHKVIDDADCARELEKRGPAFLKPALATKALTTFQKAQVINGLLRSQWVLAKDGKIARDESGNMVVAPRLLAKMG